MNKVCGICGKSCELTAWIYGDLVTCTDCKEKMEPTQADIDEKGDDRNSMKELLFTVACCVLLIIAAIVYIVVRPS